MLLDSSIGPPEDHTGDRRVARCTQRLHRLSHIEPQIRDQPEVPEVARQQCKVVDDRRGGDQEVYVAQLLLRAAGQ